jgi:hypothetical protein
VSAAELDRLLGDPWDDANPAGYAALLAGEERGEPTGPAARTLDAYGIGAEFVPPELGGRLACLGDLARVLTTAARRDAPLAAGWAFGTLDAALDVWRSGSVEQRRTTAGVLLDNRRLTDRLGTAPRQGGLIAQAVTARLGLGPLDTALRAALASSVSRRLYGGLAADLPYVRGAIARAWADLLAVDAVTSIVVASIESAAEALPVSAPCTDYLAARLVSDAFDGLRSVLGARAFLREGPFAIFQKMARDSAEISTLRGTQPSRLARISTELSRSAVGADALLNVLGKAVDTAWDDDRVHLFAVKLSRELDLLRGDVMALAAPRAAACAPPRGFGVAHRYAVLLAAACALEVSRHAAEGATGAPLPDYALLAVLDRLTWRLGLAPALTVADREDIEYRLAETAIERYHARKLFDLTARSIPG